MGATAEEKLKRPAEKNPDRATELKALLKERCDTLSKLLVLLMTRYKAGTVDFAWVAQAERDALKATVELDDSPEKRLAALQKVRDRANEFVQVAEARFKAGGVDETDVIQARAILLEARIELLREELKAQPGK
jgi:outer membrane protein TolC